MELLHLSTSAQLDDLDFRSWTRKQVIIKHSTRCFVSSIILKKIKSELQEIGKEQISFDIYLLDLIKYRETSNLIASRYKIRHESPQILIIENGACIHDASHHDVSLLTPGKLNS